MEQWRQGFCGFQPVWRLWKRLLNGLLLGMLVGLVCLGTAHAKRPKSDQTVQGLVRYVTDGDTFYIHQMQGAPVAIRIEGIDAPEMCQDFGAQSRQALMQWVLGQRVQLHVRTRDPYGRLIARVYLGSQDIGQAMVSAGQAWSYPFRRNGGPYKNEEMAARAARRGLWAMSRPVEPRVFRRRHGACAHGERPLFRAHRKRPF